MKAIYVTQYQRTKLTAAPTYKINDNFSVRAELSYYDYSKHTANSATFFAIQSVWVM